MATRPARRTARALAAGLIGLSVLTGHGCSNSTPEVDNAVSTPDPAIKPPPEPLPVQPSTSPATAGAASAPAPAPAPDAPKP